MTRVSPKPVRATLAAILLTVSTAGYSYADWDNQQQLEVNANGFWQALTYDYASNDYNLSSIGFGNGSLNYPVRDGSYVGVFLYDYTTTRFTRGYYATAQSF